MKQRNTRTDITDNNPQHPQEDERLCEWSECTEKGEHRAPKSREKLNEYRWFCLLHIRQYNKSWNYYEGMDDAEVEADKRHDTVWQRPSWKLGINAASLDPDHTIDPFDILGSNGISGSRYSETPPVCPPISKEEVDAYKTLEVEYPISSSELKTHYKGLVKIYHPDANKGSKKSEEKLKKINQAYHILRAAMSA